MPNSRPPMRASPESFRRILRYAGLGPAAFTGSFGGGFFEAIAEPEADEPPDADVLADPGDVLGDQLADRDLRVLDEGLLQQAELLVELGELPVDDLLDDLRGLARSSRLLPVDLPLGLDEVGGHFLAGDEPGVRCRDVHRDVLEELLELRSPGDEVGLAVHLHEHADLSARMDVGSYGALCRGPRGLPLRGGKPLLAEDLLRFDEAPSRLLQSALALHHADAGSLPQRRHLGRADWRLFHFSWVFSWIRRCWDARLPSEPRACREERPVPTDFRCSRAGLLARRPGLWRVRLRLRRGLPFDAPGGLPRGTPASARPPRRRSPALLTLPATGCGLLCPDGGIGLLVLHRRLVQRRSLDDAVGDPGSEQLDRTDGVVVAGDHVIDRLRITVRVHDGHDRQTQLAGLVDRYPLPLRVYHEQGVGQARHPLDTGQPLLQAGPLLLEACQLLLGLVLRLLVGSQLLQLGEPLDALAQRVEVRESAAQPAGVDIGHPAAGRFLRDRLLRLPLRPYEEDRLPLRGLLDDEARGRAELLQCPLQVDDVDAVALAENVALHLRVPPVRLMAEVNARFQQLLYRYRDQTITSESPPTPSLRQDCQARTQRSQRLENWKRLRAPG